MFNVETFGGKIINKFQGEVDIHVVILKQNSLATSLVSRQLIKYWFR